jgi:hypothetical protein
MGEGVGFGEGLAVGVGVGLGEGVGEWVGEGAGVSSPPGPLLSKFVSDSAYTTKDSSKQAHVKKMISSRLPICCFCMCSALKIFRYSHFCLVQIDI